MEGPVRKVDEYVEHIRRDRPFEYEAFNILSENQEELLARIRKIEERNLQYYVRAYSTGGTVSSGSSVPLDAEEYPQLGNMHDVNTNNSNIYIRRNGVYICTGMAKLSPVASTWADVYILRVTSIGNTFLARSRDIGAGGGAGTDYWPCCTGIGYLYEGDVLQLKVASSAGGNIDVDGDPDGRSSLTVAERREDLNRSEYGLLNPDELMR